MFSKSSNLLSISFDSISFIISNLNSRNSSFVNNAFIFCSIILTRIFCSAIKSFASYLSLFLSCLLYSLTLARLAFALKNSFFLTIKLLTLVKNFLSFKFLSKSLTSPLRTSSFPVAGPSLDSAK